MTLFVDTSVWSGAFRRDRASSEDESEALAQALQAGETLFATGLVLQELMQGFSGPKDRNRIIDLFSAVPLLVPDSDDHVRAPELRNHCRRNGVQIGTIDALLARLCIRHDLTMLSIDRDFQHTAQHSTLHTWHK